MQRMNGGMRTWTKRIRIYDWLLRIIKNVPTINQTCRKDERELWEALVPTPGANFDLLCLKSFTVNSEGLWHPRKVAILGFHTSEVILKEKQASMPGLTKWAMTVFMISAVCSLWTRDFVIHCSSNFQHNFKCYWNFWISLFIENFEFYKYYALLSTCRLLCGHRNYAIISGTIN